MDKQVGNKFTWIIKDFGSLTSALYSEVFVIGGCEWRLLAHPKGLNYDNNLSLYLDVANYESLPPGWRRHVKFSFMIVNQFPGELSQLRETQHYFGDHDDNCSWGFASMLPLTDLNAYHGGLMVNGEVKIVAEVEVLEVIGKLDVSENSKEEIQPLKKKTSSLIGVEVLPSQVESVTRIFEKHPEIVLVFLSKNPHIRTGYMNVLLSLTRTLCQSPRELSDDDFSIAGTALAYMRDAGFKMDWLEKKLEEVKEKKKKEEACLARLLEMEEKLQPVRQTCLDLEAQVDKEKAELLEARAPLSFDYLSS